MQPAIDKGYNPDDFNRLLNVGWAGSLHNFIYTTVFSGRPNSATYWPRPMPPGRRRRVVHCVTTRWKT